MGIDKMRPHVIKRLPEDWLTSIPTCFANSFQENDIAGADWNSQKLVPIPKLNKAKLTVKYFRGIAVSNVARSLCTTAMLVAIAQDITRDSPISFAYAAN
eukprot:2727636-Amphidinium_carterae.1